MQNSAISLLSELRGAGFNLMLENGTVLVSPASKLTDSERQLIRLNKKELVLALSKPPVDIGTIRPPGMTDRFLAASQALDRQIADQDLQQREGMARAATAEVLSLFTRSKPTPTDPHRFDSAPIPAPRPAPAKPPRPQVGDAAWQLREGAHRRYQAHHWGCLICIGAGQGRGDKCSTGAALWSVYMAHTEGETK